MMRELKRPVGSFLYRKIHRFLNMRTIRERMRKIHVVPEDELTRLCEEYCIRILSNSLLVFFGTLVLSVGLAVYMNRTKTSIVLNRESYGGDETVTQLETEINGEKQMISVDVLPLTYDAESIEEAFDKGFAYIDSVYLGTNENADHITEDLELIDSVDELGLRVSWEIEDESDIVDYRGEIMKIFLVQRTCQYIETEIFKLLTRHYKIRSVFCLTCCGQSTQSRNSFPMFTIRTNL